MKTLEEDLIMQHVTAFTVKTENHFGLLSLEVNKENLKKVLSILMNSTQFGFDVLMDLTAIDYLTPKVQSKLIYLLHNSKNHSRLQIALYAERGEAIPSISDLFEGANWYERELFDMFGITFEGPPLPRILMPDSWVGHPMRKDYSLTEESVQFKHGVSPKPPSQIIPHFKSCHAKNCH